MTPQQPGRGCDELGCPGKHKAQGKCSKHYQRWLGDRDAVAASVAARAAIRAAGCTVEGCGLPVKSHRMCRRHYLQWYRTGDPIPPARPTECAVAGCGEPPHCRGWCESHYSRWCYAGDPVKTETVVTCELCDQTFVRPPNGITVRCDPCRAERTRVSARDRGREKRRVALPEQISRKQARSEPCLVCGGTVIQSKPGGRMKVLCSDDCRSVHFVQWRLSYYQTDDYKDKTRARQYERRALKWAVEWESFRPREVFERDGWVCHLCRGPVDPVLRHPHRLSASLDHIVPLSRNGAHTRANTALAHLTCNISKGVRLLEELVA